MKCSVLNCKMGERDQKWGCSFFRFPFEESTLKKWIRFCRRGNLDPKNRAICMKHFASDAFENSLKFEMGFTKKRLLKRGAVPTIFKEPPAKSKRAQRLEGRTYKRVVDKLLKEYVAAERVQEHDVDAHIQENHCYEANSAHEEMAEKTITEDADPLEEEEVYYEDLTKEPTDPAEMEMEEEVSCNDLTTQATDPPEMRNEEEVSYTVIRQASASSPTFIIARDVPLEVDDFQEEIEVLRQENLLLRKAQKKHDRELAVLKKDSLCKEKKCAHQIHVLENRAIKAEQACKNMEEMLATIFTTGQIKKLKEGIQKPKWTEEDIARSKAFYSASPKEYRALYNKGFPLPAIRTLQQWAQKINKTKI